MEAEKLIPSPTVTPKKAAGPEGPGKRCFDSSDLFAGEREILIRHRGQEYRLLITRTEKLILNK